MTGRKPFPIHHGHCTDILKVSFVSNLLVNVDTQAHMEIQDAAKVIQSFMARDPEQVNFTILALTPGEE